MIGIDASKLSVAQRTGTEHYTANLLNHLPPSPPGEDIRLYLNSGTTPRDVDPRFTVRHLPSRRLWTHGRLAWQMLRHPPNVLFVPAHVIPVIHPRTVVTIHDLGYMEEPDSHLVRDRLQLIATTRWSTRAATRIIVPSHTTKQDLIAGLHINPGKVDVVPHGVDSRFSHQPHLDDTHVRARLALPPRYILAVGTIQPRKNLIMLARAIAALIADGHQYALVVAGKSGWRAQEVVSELRSTGLGHHLILTDHVADADLPALYRGASAFCMPSKYEGFGLPALEALACGVPTIVSNRGALPEVVGDAGLVVNTDSPAQMTDVLAMVLDDEPLRRRLSDAGPRRASVFTWNRSAAKTLHILREVVGASGGQEGQ